MQVHREPCFEKHDLKSQNFPKFCFLNFFSLVSLFCLHTCDLNSPFCEKWLALWGLEGTVYNAGLNLFLLIWTYLSSRVFSLGPAVYKITGLKLLDTDVRLFLSGRREETHVNKYHYTTWKLLE